MAGDKTVSAKLQEGARLFTELQQHLFDEKEAKAVETGKQALAVFRELKDHTGIADSLRTLIPIGAYQEKRKEAAEEALKEMEAFKKAGSAEGEAKMQLAFAEVSCDQRGHVHREEALQHVTAARDFFRGSRDRWLEATAILTLSTVHLKRRGDKRVEKRKAKDAAQEALEIFRELGDRKEEGKALHTLGVALVQSRRFEPGNFEAGLEANNEALIIFQELGIKKLESVELQTIAMFHTLEDQLDEALPYAQEALELQWEMQLEKGFAIGAMRALFDIYVAKNDVHRALNCAKDGLWRFQEAEDTRGEAAAWDMMSQAHCFKNEMQQGLDACEESIIILRDLEETTGEIKMIQRTASIYLRMDRCEEALSRCQDAVDRFEAAGDMENKATAMHTLAEIHNAMGDGDKAMQTAMDERETFQKAGHVCGEASSFFMMCFAHMQKGETEQAINTAREAARIFRTAEEKKGELMALRLHCELLMSAEKWDDALRAQEKVLPLAMELKDKGAEAGITLFMAQSNAMLLGRAAKDGEDPRAQQGFTRKFEHCLGLAEKAVGLARKLEDEKHISSTLCALAQVHMLDRQLEPAMQAAKEALSIAKDIGHETGEAYAMVITAEAHARGGKLDQAKKVASEGLKIFKRAEDEKGIEYASDLLKKVEEAMPKDVPQQQQHQQQQQSGPSFMSQKGTFQEAAVQEEEQRVAKTGGGGPRVDGDSIKGKVAGVTMEILGLDEDLPEDSPLMSSGLTSNSAVLLRNKLAEELPGISLPFTLVFDYPTIGSIAEYIAEQAGG